MDLNGDGAATQPTPYRPWATALSLGLGLLMLSGCAPPPVSQERPNSRDVHPMVLVKATPKPPPATRWVHGTECRVSRDPLGQFGGTFLDSSLGEGPKTFNPWAAFDATSSEVGAMMTAGLLETDASSGEVIPALAARIDRRPDGRTIRVTLRRGLRWSDGHPLTSRDVVFTWNTIIKEGLGNPSARDALLVGGQFPKVRALDALTLEFETVRPFAPFLRQLGQPIAPAHRFEPALANVPPEERNKVFSALWTPAEATAHPERFVSSGLWLLERYEPGERVVFRRNPNSWQVDTRSRRLPYLDRMVITFVKDQNNLALQFEQGKIDPYAVQGRYLQHVRSLPRRDFRLYNLGPTSATSFMAFNLTRRRQKDTGAPLVDPVRSRWFNTLAFRQAVDWAINREDMVQNILRGVGEPLFTSESLAALYLNPKLAKGHPQNLAHARQLLKGAGFTWDSRGKLHDPQGHPVVFDLVTNSGNDEREATGVSIQQDLAALGMTVRFRPMEFNVLVGRLSTGEWETMVMGLTGSPLEPHDGANVWRSNGALHLFNQRDTQVLNGRIPTDRLPWEAEIDALIDAGAETLDPAGRRKIYDRLQAILYEQVPMVYLYSPVSILALRTRIQNADPLPLGRLHNLDSLWVGSNRPGLSVTP